MGIKVKSIGLIGLGVLAGIGMSLQFPAMAQKITNAPLPLDELRQLSDVFGLIKTDYVEKVEDKKLLTEAISGMVGVARGTSSDFAAFDLGVDKMTKTILKGGYDHGSALQREERAGGGCDGDAAGRRGL